MTGSRKGAVVLIALWIVVGSIYVWAAWQQKQRVNLSAAAGGQMPYLVYAQGVAGDGLANHFGDRNRMPLVPSLLSFVYHENWDTFVSRAASFAIVSSGLILIGIGFLAYRHLPRWPATVLTLTATCCVFLPNSPLVQAAVGYYSTLFAGCLRCCASPSRGGGLRAEGRHGHTTAARGRPGGVAVSSPVKAFWRMDCLSSARRASLRVKRASSR